MLSLEDMSEKVVNYCHFVGKEYKIIIPVYIAMGLQLLPLHSRTSSGVAIQIQIWN